MQLKNHLIGGQVKHVMTDNPICCSLNTPLTVVARSMNDFNCGEIPVLDSNHEPIGVITDRDITCRSVAEGKNPLKMTAADCMTRECITVGLDASIDECCAIMKEHKIRRLPVVDEFGCCCGIVSQADIALYAPKETTGEVLQEVSKAA